MNHTSQSRTTKDTTQKSINQPKLNFTHQKPNQTTRKFFHANFNLSSSASLKRLTRDSSTKNLSNLSSRQDSVETNNQKANLLKSSQNSKASEQTVKKAQIVRNGSKFNGKGNLAESLELPLKQKKSLGEWIKPKYIQQLDSKKSQKLANIEPSLIETHQKSQAQQYQGKIDHIQGVQKVIEEKTQAKNNSFIQIPSIKNIDPKQIVDNQQDFLKPDDLIAIEPNQLQFRPKASLQPSTTQNSSPVKDDQTRGSEVTISLTKINSEEKVSQSGKEINSPQTEKRNIKLTESVTQIAAKKTSRNSNFYLSPQQKSREKRYSKFKDLVLEDKKKREQQKKMSSTISFQIESTTKPTSTSLSSSTKISQTRTPILSQSSQLPPAHFSFTAQNSYLKKYQQLTSTPSLFIQSLKQLRNSEEDDEHEYFRYEKNQKKLMYYEGGKRLKQDFRKRNQNCVERDNDEEKKRKVSYSKFVENIKKKPIEAQNYLDSPKISKQQCTETLDRIPQPIIQAKNQSSLLSNRIKLSSNDSKNDTSQRSRQLQQQNQISKKIFVEQNALNTHQILMFRKNHQRNKKLKDKIERIRLIEKELCQQNNRINHQFSERRRSQLKKFNPQSQSN